MLEPSAQTIIHLLDWRECGPPAAWSIAALRAHAAIHAPHHTHRVLLLAPAHERHAAEQWLAAPPDACRTITHARLSIPRELITTNQTTTLVAWSRRTLRLAARLKRSNIQLAAFLLRPTTRATHKLTAALANQGRAAFASAWTRDHSKLDQSPIIPLPTPDLARTNAKPDRAWLDLHDADERLTIAAIGWPGTAVSATRASYIAGVLAIGGHQTTAIIPANAEDLERATRFAHRHNDAWPVFATHAADPKAIAAADVALWCGHPGAMLEVGDKLPQGIRSIRPAPLAESLLMPLALGIPIVAESTHATREILGAQLNAQTEKQVKPPRWLTPIGDRLTMNRAAFAMLTNHEHARDNFLQHARTITATRTSDNFASAFAAWINQWSRQAAAHAAHT